MVCKNCLKPIFYSHDIWLHNTRYRSEQACYPTTANIELLFLVAEPA